MSTVHQLRPQQQPQRRRSDAQGPYLPELTPQQQMARAQFEAAMRSGRLRRLPTCFGELDEVPA